MCGAYPYPQILQRYLKAAGVRDPSVYPSIEQSSRSVLALAPGSTSLLTWVPDWRWIVIGLAVAARQTGADDRSALAIRLRALSGRWAVGDSLGGVPAISYPGGPAQDAGFGAVAPILVNPRQQLEAELVNNGANAATIIVTVQSIIVPDPGAVAPTW